MNPNVNDFLNLSQFLFGLDLLTIIQWLVIIFVLLYLIFALVIVRQVQLMSKTLITSVSPLLLFLAIINVGFTLFVLIILFGTL